MRVVYPEVNTSDVYDETAQLYKTGGFWLLSTQLMNGKFPLNKIAQVSFDAHEELVWCVTRTGQLTSFYGPTLELYTSSPVPPTTQSGSSSSNFTELRNVFPSTRANDDTIYVLAKESIYAFSKFGRLLGMTGPPQMQSLECISPFRSNGYMDFANNASDFDRFFCGGLQAELLEVDAEARWGQVLRVIDVGEAGCVLISPFSMGLCAANTKGQVMIVDPRVSQGIIRCIDAHSGEISDMTIANHGCNLVTCGWSRLNDSSLRVDRMLNVFDLRFGRSQAPVSLLLDPAFVRFFPNCSDRLLTASQSGIFQVVEWGEQNLSPDSLGNLLLNYDQLVSTAISPSGECLLFGCDSGSIHLYSRAWSAGGFHTAPRQSLFASPVAAGLRPADFTSPSGESPLLPATGAAALAAEMGAEMQSMAAAAANTVDLQVFSNSLHQPLTGSAAPSHAALLEFAERKRLECVCEAMSVPFRPVSFDDNGFALSSVPFIASPPPCNPVELAEWVSVETASRRAGITSDWPSDLCGSRRRSMIPVDPAMIAQLNQKCVVRKPSTWGPVWHPYAPLGAADFPDLSAPARRPREEMSELEIILAAKS